MPFRLLKLLALLTILSTQAAALNANTDASTENQIRQAMHRIQPLVEFGELYTNGFYFLKKENGRDILEVRTLLRPYYELVMRVPVFPPHSTEMLLQKGPAEVELWKISKISRDASGTVLVDRDFPQTLISTTDWLRLYQAQGNFSAIGIVMSSGMDIEGLKDYRDQLRKEAHVGW